VLDEGAILFILLPARDSVATVAELQTCEIIVERAADS
jgi:hypothetical protein